ncbi:hypothetical protein LRS13_19935 [Svornostia abyssi]|uniref:Uncharacterized protein n=1 Tax=Svornostia abyssi TaxID=2898438 RepID=A0ABY5PEU4_9ACTN|nr:hypothetical protein LRS13_19935 [Parviterribacteraceae bacterium J379]
MRKQAKLKSTTVGRLSRTLRPGDPVTVAIKLDPKAVRALKRLRSVTLTLTFVVTDNAQNRTTRTQRVTLRR